MISAELQQVIDIARGAGDILLKYFRQDIQVDYKTSKFDPVTQADREADAYIRESLARAFPDDEILSEEHHARPGSYQGRVWMADPLDGTKDFVAGNDGFSTLIGLWEGNQPKLGVVSVPAQGLLYYAETGKGAFRVSGVETTELHVSNVQSIEEARLLTRIAKPGDDRPIEQSLNKLPFKQRIAEASIGTKVCLIASGQGECFVHTNLLASKWDTLAAQAILVEAGGILTDVDGNPLDYTQPDVSWGRFFVASNNQAIHEQVLAALKGQDQSL